MKFVLLLFLIFNATVKLCHGFSALKALVPPISSRSSPGALITPSPPSLDVNSLTIFRKKEHTVCMPFSSALCSNKNDDDTTGKEENVIGKLVNGIFYLFSYAIQFLGVAFSLGLLLNLCGYGYTVDMHRGVEIDRIDNIRRERQFQNEILKTSKISALPVENAPPR